MGHAVIMGRKTWDEVGKPLPGRRNLVVSRQPEHFSQHNRDVALLQHLTSGANLDRVRQNDLDFFRVRKIDCLFDSLFAANTHENGLFTIKHRDHRFQASVAVELSTLRSPTWRPACVTLFSRDGVCSSSFLLPESAASSSSSSSVTSGLRLWHGDPSPLGPRLIHEHHLARSGRSLPIDRDKLGGRRQDLNGEAPRRR